MGHALKHRFQPGGDARAAFVAAGAHFLAEFQLVVLRRDGRRHDDQHIRVGVVAPALGVQRLFHQPHNAQRDQIRAAVEPVLAVVRAQHDGHGVQRRVAHQNRRDERQAVHPLGDGIVKHGRAAGQAFLNHRPAVAQQILQHHGVALVVAVTSIPGRVIAVGVGIAVAKHAAAGHVFISHKSGFLS